MSWIIGENIGRTRSGEYRFPRADSVSSSGGFSSIVEESGSSKYSELSDLSEIAKYSGSVKLLEENHGEISVSGEASDEQGCVLRSRMLRDHQHVLWPSIAGGLPRGRRRER
jgi:hypothetical protein